MSQSNKSGKRKQWTESQMVGALDAVLIKQTLVSKHITRNLYGYIGRPQVL